MIQADIEARQTQLDDALRRFGASMVGFCSVADVDMEICRKLPTGIVIAIDLGVDSIRELDKDEVKYHRTIQTARDRLYRIYGIGVQLLRQWGFSYFPVPDNPLAETLPDMRAEVPVVPLAVRAGLGWVGKSGLVITPRYGPRVHLGAILTDAPFEKSKSLSHINHRCGECRACIEACPVQAIKGKYGWGRDLKKEGLTNGSLCNEYRRDSLATLGRKAECAICIASCPVGLDNPMNPELFSGRSKVDAGLAAENSATLQGGAEGSPSSVDPHILIELTPEELAFLTGDDDMLSEDLADVVDGPEEPIDLDEDIDLELLDQDLEDLVKDLPDFLAMDPLDEDALISADPEVSGPRGATFPDQDEAPEAGDVPAVPESAPDDGLFVESKATSGVSEAVPEGLSEDPAPVLHIAGTPVRTVDPVIDGSQVPVSPEGPGVAQDIPIRTAEGAVPELNSDRPLETVSRGPEDATPLQLRSTPVVQEGQKPVVQGTEPGLVQGSNAVRQGQRPNRNSRQRRPPQQVIRNEVGIIQPPQPPVKADKAVQAVEPQGVKDLQSTDAKVAAGTTNGAGGENKQQGKPGGNRNRRRPAKPQAEPGQTGEKRQSEPSRDPKAPIDKAQAPANKVPAPAKTGTAEVAKPAAMDLTGTGPKDEAAPQRRPSRPRRRPSKPKTTEVPAES